MKRSHLFSSEEQSQSKRRYSRNSTEGVDSTQSFVHLSNSNKSGVRSGQATQADPFLDVTREMWKYFINNHQSIEVYQRKVELKEALRHMFSEIFPYLGVYIVGSSANGFGTNGSDMDICLMVSHEEINQKTEALLLLKALAKAMRRTSFIRNLQVIAAKVPIIKFHDSHNKIDCDINLNSHIGIRNTHLMKVYSDIDWRVKPLILNIKRWARFHGINDASQKTISSYSFALMALFYLQSVCEPPVVPVLHRTHPEKFNPNSDITKLRLNESYSSWTSSNKQSLGELFVGFLNFYANFDFSSHVISIRLGKLIPKDCLPQDDLEACKSSCMQIEEPFDLSNTARSVFDIYTFNEIKSVFKKSARVIRSELSLDSIISSKFGDFN